MAMIYITCPDCIADTSMQGRAMLATLDLGEFLGPLGQLSSACLSCGRFVTAEREVAHLLRRITASISLLVHRLGRGAVAEEDNNSSAPPRPHAEHPGAGPPFSLEDVLTLRELLETDAWIERLDEPPQGSS